MLDAVLLVLCCCFSSCRSPRVADERESKWPAGRQLARSRGPSAVLRKQEPSCVFADHQLGKISLPLRANGTLLPGAAGADFLRGRPGLWAWPQSLPRRLLVEAGNGTGAVTGAWKAVPGGPLPTRRRRFFLRGATRFGAGAWPWTRRPGRRGVLGTEPTQWPKQGRRLSNFSCYLTLRRPEQVLLAPAPH